MKSYEARELAYRMNKKQKGVLEINKLIEAAATSGKFEITTLVCYDWGSDYDLQSHYQSLGYTVSLSHRQTSPNDGDDFIQISWNEI